jgi:hypothetical protein
LEFVLDWILIFDDTLLAPLARLVWKKQLSAFTLRRYYLSTMPFLAKEHHPVPTKDLLSWTFDDLSYDWDDPVSNPNPLPLSREKRKPLKS